MIFLYSLTHLSQLFPFQSEVQVQLYKLFSKSLQVAPFLHGLLRQAGAKLEIENLIWKYHNFKNYTFLRILQLAPEYPPEQSHT